MSTVPLPVQTTADIHDRSAILLASNPAYQPIRWVGVFGSFSRSKQTPESDVDIIIGYDNEATPDQVFRAAGAFVEDAPEAFGRPVEAIHMMKREVQTYLMMEALLTSVGIYGPDEWPERHIEQSRESLDNGYRRLTKAYELLQRVRTDLKTNTRDVIAFGSEKVIAGLPRKTGPPS